MNSNKKPLKKKFQDFAIAFSWFLSCDVISNDLGFTKLDESWFKYVGPTLFGLLWTFFIFPGNKTAKKKEGVATDLNTGPR
jgi:hypothetical protein